ncbi:hypothetical protein JXL21_10600 [Candidatus Bathyarchaeota archaeon]|nr:hypothetical protein [Candidatus Bathyarchaeota archaeon]
MPLEFREWGTSREAGKGYGGQVGGRWCSVMETRRGAYRGDHIHSVDQYTVLLDGALMIVKQVDGVLVEQRLVRDRLYVTEAGVPHVTVALEDSVSYEWWEGPSSMERCPGVFDEYLSRLHLP